MSVACTRLETGRSAITDGYQQIDIIGNAFCCQGIGGAGGAGWGLQSGRKNEGKRLGEGWRKRLIYIGGEGTSKNTSRYLISGEEDLFTIA